MLYNNSRSRHRLIFSTAASAGDWCLQSEEEIAASRLCKIYEIVILRACGILSLALFMLESLLTSPGWRSTGVGLIWKMQLLQLQRSRNREYKWVQGKGGEGRAVLHAKETFDVFQMTKIQTVLFFKKKKPANLKSSHTHPAAKHNKWVRNIMYLPVKHPRKPSSCAGASTLPLSITSRACAMTAEATGRRAGRGQRRRMDQGWTWAIAACKAGCKKWPTFTIRCWCGALAQWFDTAHVTHHVQQ